GPDQAPRHSQVVRAGSPGPGPSPFAHPRKAGAAHNRKTDHMYTRDITVGGRTISIETGRMAKQADGTVVVRSGDAVVLVSACAAVNPREGIDFLPLTVDYKENTYASGPIPGGFFKREGKPAEKEVLTSRLIDRPIRP